MDDGSVDATPAILTEYVQRLDFFRVLRLADRGERSVGPGVVDAFYAGYETIDGIDYDYICKLDVDLELPAHYFERLMDVMESKPRLGCCSGKAYYVDSESDSLVSEGIDDEMCVGASKFYRRQCFEDIGGFVREVMWDGIDCHRCRQLGWIACSIEDPDLRFIHLRPMGSSQEGIVRGRMRHGFGQYFMGTSLAYMTASALYRMTRPPRLVGGAAMWWGYVRSMLRGEPRYHDQTFRRFLRSYQWDCLLRGKRRATKRLNTIQEMVWRSKYGSSH